MSARSELNQANNRNGDLLTVISTLQKEKSELEKRIGELEAQIEADESAERQLSLKYMHALTAERQRREACEAALDYVEPNLINGSNSWLAVRAYRSRYPSESDNRTKVAG